MCREWLKPNIVDSLSVPDLRREQVGRCCWYKSAFKFMKNKKNYEYAAHVYKAVAFLLASCTFRQCKINFNVTNLSCNLKTRVLLRW